MIRIQNGFDYKGIEIPFYKSKSTAVAFSNEIDYLVATGKLSLTVPATKFEITHIGCKKIVTFSAL